MCRKQKQVLGAEWLTASPAPVPAGTYMAIHAVHRLERAAAAAGSGVAAASVSATAVAKVVGLFPFLAVNPQCPQQAKIRQLARRHDLVARLVSVLQLLPAAASRFVRARLLPTAYF